MSGPIREQRQKCHYSSSIGVESRTGTVVESKTRLTSKRNFVLDSTTFLIFVSRIPRKAAKSLPVHCDGSQKPNKFALQPIKTCKTFEHFQLGLQFHCKGKSAHRSYEAHELTTLIYNNLV